ncbi:MAG: large subunit ribosomal protein L1 [Microgenomates group bacterium Gr01-1014_5]|nr:MAG: large subunit ribosomal protein L1 [Microgenomates group bacterium Gr01-1014_5]
MGKTKLNIIGQEVEKKEKSSKKDQKVHLAGLKGGQRVKVIDAEPVVAQNIQEVNEVQRENTEHARGKKYLAARAKVDPKKTYNITDAVKLLKETSVSKFDGSVELHLVLAKDSLNTSIELPHPTGKTRKIEIANDATVEKLKTGKVDFDVLLASPDIMHKLVPFAKLLGPKGLMPNPKNGTLLPDPEKAKDQFGGNNINLKTEKSAPLIHTVVAKTSQPEKEIEENIKAVLINIGEKNIKKAVVSASMGPGIQVSVA